MVILINTGNQHGSGILRNIDFQIYVIINMLGYELKDCLTCLILFSHILDKTMT